MPWRFQRRVNILPAVRLNFSKSGVSTSFGHRGIGWYTINKHGTRTTIDTPIPGLWHTSYRRHADSRTADSSAPPGPPASTAVRYVNGRFIRMPNDPGPEPVVTPTNPQPGLGAFLIAVAILGGLGAWMFGFVGAIMGGALAGAWAAWPRD